MCRFLLVAEVSGIHSVPGVIVECPCTIQSRKTLPNGAPGINILLGQNVYPIRSSPSHISVPLNVLRFYGNPVFISRLLSHATMDFSPS